MRIPDSLPSTAKNGPTSDPSMVRYLNRYQPPVPAGELHCNTPLEEYDLNFGPAREVPRLTGSFVELRPLIPSIHGELTYEYCHDVNYIEEIMAPKLGSFEKLEGWLRFIERIRSQPNYAMFAVFVDPAIFDPAPDNLPRWIDDPTATPGTETWVHAGTLGLLNASPTSLAASIGISIVRQCSGRGVGTQASALLIDWCMRLPHEGGLGMRRFGWRAFVWNEASQTAALGLGLKYAGVMRNMEVSDFDRGGEQGREGDKQWPKQSRHHWESDGTSDDWEFNGWKELVRGFIHGRPRLQARSGDSTRSS